MSASLESGHSIALLSLLTSGMHYACPKARALDALERLMLIAVGDIACGQDAQLIEPRIHELLRLPRCVRDAVASRILYQSPFQKLTAHV